MRRTFRLVALLALVLSGLAIPGATAAPIANHAFQTTWERTDQPVASGAVSRTWMWGGYTWEGQEPYAEAPAGTRTVQYFDKSRMEDNSYRASAPWDVTNGLLVVEMVDGRYQTGDTSFDESPEPADVPVGGDPDDATGPTYRTIGMVRNQPAAADGALITARLARDGTITNDAGTAGYGIHAGQRLTVPGIDHQIAAPFWSFMNSSGLVNVDGQLVTDKLFENPYYATGYPITEPYWATVKVANVQRDLLVQCFERRCLTYNPANDPAWQVEAGNVGQHYERWRHGDQEPVPIGQEATVTNIVDGDTIDVLINDATFRVRYIGIDTPETYGGVQCYGNEAKAKNTELVLGKMVTLVKDVSETDQFGRLLRYVYQGSTFVNDELVRQGYAYASTYPPDVAFADQFAVAQAEAQANGRGLWSACEPPPSECDPAYPTVCIPSPPPDLDCSDIEFRRFTVLPPDPHNFDSDGDGVGCETG